MNDAREQLDVCRREYGKLEEHATNLGTLHEVATERLARVRLWLERHSEHAGRAPLSELRAILDGD